MSQSSIGPYKNTPFPTNCGSALHAPASDAPADCRRRVNMFWYRGSQLYPTIIPGLRSPSDQIEGLVYFGRMLDKIRLAAEKLPEGWQASRGWAAKGSFDDRCCAFLHLDYATLEAEVLKADKSDEELLAWAYAHGRQPSETEIEVGTPSCSNAAGATPYGARKPAPRRDRPPARHGPHHVRIHRPRRGPLQPALSLPNGRKRERLTELAMPRAVCG